jgi:nicotinate-nucleotide pyrophosphorylase (carboxylating)
MKPQIDSLLRTDITRAVAAALNEDIGQGDITAELVPANKVSRAEIITREHCVVCGAAWLDEVFRQLGGVETPTWHVQDGDSVTANTKLVTLAGNARALLTGERTALNFLQTLSGTATLSRQYARLVEGTEIKILDTRKTLPGLRLAQKYAVAVGGCHNHRIGLYDAFLIKENHISACGSITQAVARAKELHPDKPIIVEVETLKEFHEATQCAVDRIMLDNFNDAQINEIAQTKTAIPIEVSGNLNDETIAKLLNKGIAAISSGALTKHVRAIDLSMRFV